MAGTRLQPFGRESVARVDLCGIDSAFEPRDALRARAVCEGFGNHRAARAALQRVIADLRSCVERRFNIAGFKAPTLFFLRTRGPYTGEAVGLQFQSHTECIGLCLVRLITLRVNLS